MGVFDRFFGGRRPSWESPGVGLPSVTASDTVPDPAGPFRSLWVGGAGNVKVTALDGSTNTLTNVPVGILPISVLMVWSTGTTATGIVGIL